MASETEFFAFDELTWPETAVLSRTTPLIIPMGTGYDLARLADCLAQPARVGLLPAVPFGWRGSGPTPLISPCLRGCGFKERRASIEI